ncbi:MAG: isochorismatase family protein [Pseudomonadota bacterium]
MPLLDVNRSVLVVIDLQGSLVHLMHRSARVQAAAQRLLGMASLFRVPVILTEQYPKGLGPTAPEIRAAFDSLEVPRALVEKTSFGCTGEPSFLQALARLSGGLQASDRQIVVAGIEAHVCVLQTVLELKRSDHDVHVVWEAVSSRSDEARGHALERMQQAGAVLTSHESVGFEWARDKQHPSFKAMSALIREPLS